MKKFIVFLLLISFVNPAYSQGIKERFRGSEKLTYKVYYNGMFSGHIWWRYKGVEQLDDKQAEIINVSSDTKILGLLDLTSDEDIFLDSHSYLPVKVERDVLIFGKKQLITETYNQSKGYVKITYRGDEEKEEIVHQDKPIQNILALLYFFPQNVKLEKNQWMNFNLPTQTIKIKFIKERMLRVGGVEQNTYFLLGRGGKRFSLWLDKTTRLPLRLEFVSILGKVSIVRVNE